MGLGAAATNALWDFMAQREKDRRQAFVDAISQQGADRADREEKRLGEQANREQERQMAQLDLNKRQIEVQEAAAKRATADAERAAAETVTKTTAPGAKLQPGQADVLRRGNMGGLIRTPPMDPIAAERMPGIGTVDMNREVGAEFTGSVNFQQGMQFAQELRARGENDKADFIEAQLRTGDSSMAAGPFTDPRLSATTVNVDGRMKTRVFNPATGGFELHDMGAVTTTAQKMGEMLGGGPSAWEKFSDEIRVDMLDNLITNANAYTVGVGGSLLAWVPGTEAKKFQHDSVAFLGSAATKAMTEMRKAASEMGQKGSGFGQVTERELALLERTFGGLSPEMSPSDFKASARDIRARLMRWKEIQEQYAAEQAAKRGGKAPAVVAPAAAPANDGWTVIDGVRIREKK